MIYPEPAANIAAPSTTYTIITQKPAGKTAPAPQAGAALEEVAAGTDTSVNAELDAQLDAQLQGYEQDPKAGNLLNPA